MGFLVFLFFVFIVCPLLLLGLVLVVLAMFASFFNYIRYPNAKHKTSIFDEPTPFTNPWNKEEPIMTLNRPLKD